MIPKWGRYIAIFVSLCYFICMDPINGIRGTYQKTSVEKNIQLSLCYKDVIQQEKKTQIMTSRVLPIHGRVGESLYIPWRELSLRYCLHRALYYNHFGQMVLDMPENGRTRSGTLIGTVFPFSFVLRTPRAVARKLFAFAV